jgi:hypothetical protein
LRNSKQNTFNTDKVRKELLKVSRHRTKGNQQEESKVFKHSGTSFFLQN